MRRHWLMTFFSKRKVLIFLSLVGVLGTVVIRLTRNGALPPRTPSLSAAQLDFSKVIGVPAPPSMVRLRSGSTGSFADPIDWISFTVSQADLSKIIKQGQFQINWSMVPGLGPYPTPKDIAHRGKYLTFSNAVNAPAWWKPAHQPSRYITYERNTEIEDVTTLRVLVVTPGSKIIYAAYSRPF